MKEETEAQRGTITLAGTHRLKAVELRFEPCRVILDHLLLSLPHADVAIRVRWL